MKYFLSLLFYRVLFIVLLPLLLLFLIIRSKNHPEYRQRLLERLGFISSNMKKEGIIVHAASVGEVIALKAFIEKLLVSYPNIPITVTTFTPTGSAQVKKLFANRVQHCYLPIDSWLCTWFFLSSLKPKAMIFMETELWPNLIAQCKSRHIKLLLVNGRLSTKSMNSYQKLQWLIKPTLNAFDKILTQSQVNQDNFVALGGNELRCELSGNLKFDISVNPNVIKKQAELAKYIEQPRKLWVIASTHKGDEALILKSFKELYKQHTDLLLVIVPRHPERFNEVAELCIKEGFTTTKRSECTPVNSSTHVWILDTLGELMPMCALASVVTMGGSFSDIGGHNPLEPALFKKPVIVGSNMSNFTEVMEQLSKAQGIIQLSNSQPNNAQLNNAQLNNVEQLTNTMAELLQNETQQSTLGENAYKVVLQNQGASDKSLKHLALLLA